jgi:hypothetical protein
MADCSPNIPHVGGDERAVMMRARVQPEPMLRPTEEEERRDQPSGDAMEGGRSHRVNQISNPLLVNEASPSGAHDQQARRAGNPGVS